MGAREVIERTGAGYYDSRPIPKAEESEEKEYEGCCPTCPTKGCKGCVEKGFSQITAEELALQELRAHACGGCGARMTIWLLPDQPTIQLSCRRCGHVATYRVEEERDGST